MRSRASHTITSREVHRCALSWLVDSMRMKDHGWLCTSDVVWSIVLRAAARTCSLLAACRDLANGPSEQAVLNALVDGLPKTLQVLENRLNGALVDRLPRHLKRRSWPVAIDWHLVPYYGEPKRSRNENLLRKASAGDQEVSCLRIGLHRLSGSPLHLGGHVGPAPRNDGRRPAAPAAADSWKRAENQAFALGSGLFQRDGHALSASRTSTLSDASDVSRADHQEQEAKTHRAALDQAPKSRLVSPYPLEQNASGSNLDLCGVPHPQEPQRREAEATKAVVWSLACPRNAEGDSGHLPHTIRHRNQLPTVATSAGSSPAPAILICGCCSS